MVLDILRAFQLESATGYVVMSCLCSPCLLQRPMAHYSRPRTSFENYEWNGYIAVNGGELVVAELIRSFKMNIGNIQRVAALPYSTLSKHFHFDLLSPENLSMIF